MTHTLANGATIVHLSLHSFKFSDGTESPGQNKELVDKFTLKKKFEVLREIKGMKVTKTSFVLDEQQKDEMTKLAQSVDIVLVSFQLLQALNDSGLKLPNVVAFNSTPETARLQPDQKVVDVNNWSGV